MYHIIHYMIYHIGLAGGVLCSAGLRRKNGSKTPYNMIYYIMYSIIFFGSPVPSLGKGPSALSRMYR